MKKFILVILIFVGVFNVNAQNISNTELLKMNVFEVCDALGVPSEYNARYEIIILQLCKEGVILFDGSMNPYVQGENMAQLKKDFGERWNWYYYIGNGPQNQKFIRNLVMNRHLIKNGKLIKDAGKKWKISS